jgi:hypothetical protein
MLDWQAIVLEFFLNFTEFCGIVLVFSLILLTMSCSVRFGAMIDRVLSIRVFTESDFYAGFGG